MNFLTVILALERGKKSTMFSCLILHGKTYTHFLKVFGLKKVSAMGFKMFQKQPSIRTMLRAIIDKFTRLQS